MIESPGFPDKYPHNLECSYMIIAPPHMDVTLTFLTFDLENDPLLVGEGDCKYDWLDVWDGLPQGEDTHTLTSHRKHYFTVEELRHPLVPPSLHHTLPILPPYHFGLPSSLRASESDDDYLAVSNQTCGESGKWPKSGSGEAF